MTKYKCEKCGLKTNKKTDYSRHIKTKKHLRKVHTVTNESQNYHKELIRENKYKCPFCENTYSRSCNLARHKKACGIKVALILEKDELIKQNEMDNLKKENERIQKQFDEYKKQQQIEKELYQKQLDTFAALLQSSVGVSKGNTLTYIVNNYSSAPALKALPSYKHILDADTMTLAQVLIMYQQQGNLCRFISEFLIKSYVKKDADSQAMWSSDTSRLTYIVNELQESGKIRWTMDKKGLKIKKYVIDPLLEYLRKEIENYIEENSNCTDNHALSRLQASAEIYNIIDKGILANDIVKYMAPYFTLLKEDTKKIENKESLVSK